MLHLSKVAVGCEGVAELAARLAGRAANGITSVTTRFRPKRADEVVGGSLYWIHKHRIVARSTITGFGEGVKDGRACCLILLEDRLVPVRTRFKRVHQGWRYLEPADAPPDLAGDADTGDMPAEMIAELSGLALI